MSAIIAYPKDADELKLIAELLQKHGINSKVLIDNNDKELGLIQIMKDVDCFEIASEQEVMFKLKASQQV